jgi:two-component system nitrogen regulation response regulator NtrX
VSGTILLVEDEPLVRDLLEAILTDDGHDVRVFVSYEQILRAACEDSDALVIADFWGLSHQDLDDDERQQVVAIARTVPTIVVTGRTWAQTITAEELGLVALLRKPFDIDEMATLVSDIFADPATSERHPLG